MDSRNLLPMNSATQSADFLPVVPFRSVICGMYADRMAFMALLTLLVTQSELHRLVILQRPFAESATTLSDRIAVAAMMSRYAAHTGKLPDEISITKRGHDSNKFPDRNITMLFYF